MISISGEVEHVLGSLEEELGRSSPVVLGYVRGLVYEVVAERYTVQYVKRRRRINALKSPFKTVRDMLQEIVGENIETVGDGVVIDTGVLDGEKGVARGVLDGLSYSDCLEFLRYSNRHGLVKANRRWVEK